MLSHETLLETFKGLDTPKVWSLIATIFGDLDGDTLTGKQLRALLQAVDVKPETIRVALHRLKNDGWIVSSKTGREVSYALSDFGREETRSAQEDVYRSDPKYAEVGAVLAVEDEHVLSELKGNSIALAKNLVLMLDPMGPLPDGALVLTSTDHPIPQWVQVQLVSPHLLQQAEGLLRAADRFDQTQGNLNQEANLSARLLFIHYWRRLALRDGTWAHIGLMPDGRVAQCHKRVTDILARTKRLTPPKT